MIDLNEIEGKTLLVTGATGLIGQSIIKYILKWNEKSSKPIKVLALIRDYNKALKVYTKFLNNDLRFIVSDINELSSDNLVVDYIIHAASETSSRTFVNEPLNTIFTALNGTKKILDLANKSNILGMVYLSSMEVYGAPETDEKIYENHGSNLDTMAVRSCYPESKRMCENLCAAYHAKYELPIMVVRLTQTFGPGVQYNDSRVFAEFARCAIEGRDIILNTKGDTKRSYLYTEDAVDAILTVLLKGVPGEAYNAANESTYCSIYEMASLVAKELSSNRSKVLIQATENLNKHGYAPTLHMNLDTRKLCSLGWKPKTDLKTMYSKMIEDMKIRR